MIVVDASALIAILREESEATAFVSILARPGEFCIAAPSYFETMLVALAKKDEAGAADVRSLIADFKILVVPWTSAMAELAAEAHQRFGRGRHKAGLNFGDCMAYALAKSIDAPLLYKGGDFELTDIRSAA